MFFQSPPVLRRLSTVNFVLDLYGNRGSRTNNLKVAYIDIKHVGVPGENHRPMGK